MRIDVTQEDIDNGTPKNCGKCPIALAAKRAFINNNLEFTDLYVTLFFLVVENKENKTVFDLPRESDRFITFFDQNQKVLPFSFEVGDGRSIKK